MNFPSHVAIIMDGNGRWGIKKKNSRNFGHKKGIEVEEKPSNLSYIARVYSKLSGGVNARYSRTAKRHAEHLTNIRLVDTTT